MISSDMTVFPDEHLCHILIYGSNVYNSVSNGLIITETIKYFPNSGRFTELEAFRQNIYSFSQSRQMDIIRDLCRL